MRASVCADDILISRYRVIEGRREGYRTLALASALPWALALLFAWRGRRESSSTV
jgi:hypothetical protein